MESKLPDIIKTERRFIDVLCLLSPKRRTVLRMAMKDKLPDIIKSERGLIRIITLLPADHQLKALLDARKKKLPKLIKNKTLSPLQNHHRRNGKKKAGFFKKSSKKKNQRGTGAFLPPISLKK